MTQRSEGQQLNMDLESVSSREAFENKFPRKLAKAALASEHSIADTS